MPLTLYKVAEAVGFEPTTGSSPILVFKTSDFYPLTHASVNWRHILVFVIAEYDKPYRVEPARQADEMEPAKQAGIKWSPR